MVEFLGACPKLDVAPQPASLDACTCFAPLCDKKGAHACEKLENQEDKDKNPSEPPSMLSQQMLVVEEFLDSLQSMNVTFKMGSHYLLFCILGLFV